MDLVTVIVTVLVVSIISGIFWCWLGQRAESASSFRRKKPLARLTEEERASPQRTMGQVSQR